MNPSYVIVDLHPDESVIFRVTLFSDKLYPREEENRTAKALFEARCEHYPDLVETDSHIAVNPCFGVYMRVITEFVKIQRYYPITPSYVEGSLFRLFELLEIDKYELY